MFDLRYVRAWFAKPHTRPVSGFASLPHRPRRPHQARPAGACASAVRPAPVAMRCARNGAVVTNVRPRAGPGSVRVAAAIGMRVRPVGSSGGDRGSPRPGRLSKGRTISLPANLRVASYAREAIRFHRRPLLRHPREQENGDIYPLAPAERTTCAGRYTLRRRFGHFVRVVNGPLQ